MQADLGEASHGSSAGVSSAFAVVASESSASALSAGFAFVVGLASEFFASVFSGVDDFVAPRAAPVDNASRIASHAATIRRINIRCVSSFGAEQAVARVAQARKNVAVRVQLGIDGGGVDRNVGMILQQPGNALGRRHKHNNLMCRAPARLTAVMPSEQEPPVATSGR